MTRETSQTVERRSGQILKRHDMAEDSARQANLETHAEAYAQPLRLPTDDDDDDRNSICGVIPTAHRLTGVDLTHLCELLTLVRNPDLKKMIADSINPSFTFFELLRKCIVAKIYRSTGYSGKCLQ